MGSTFGFGVTGGKIGFAAGGAYGAWTTKGKVSQIPKGGFIRAIKFSGRGGLMAGICVPTIIAGLTTGLFFAGIIALNTALAVSTFGLSLIVPLIIFGVYAGYQYACLTGKDVEAEKPDSVFESLSRYEAPNLDLVEVFVA